MKPEKPISKERKSNDTRQAACGRFFSDGEGGDVVAGVDMEINTELFLKAMEKASDKALEIIAGKIEAYAIQNIQSNAPHELAPELANSIASEVENGVITVGSNQQVAAYIELGTGPMYESPPEYMENNAKGGKGQAGISSWWYFDPVDNVFKIGTPQPARPFLRPAIQDHMDEYGKIIEGELNNAEA